MCFHAEKTLRVEHEFLKRVIDRLALENGLHDGKAMVALAGVLDVTDVGTPELVLLNNSDKALGRGKVKQFGWRVRVMRIPDLALIPFQFLLYVNL